jgi:hypothetical protein
MASPAVKMRRQDRNACRYAGVPTLQCIPHKTHVRIAVPTVIDINIVWNITVMRTAIWAK